MEFDRDIWVDGEQIPQHQLANVYRRAPEAPARFDRNTLVVGPRGVGKTVLLRYHASKHNGLAIYLQLSSELDGIAKESGHGFYSTDIPLDSANRIAAKSCALLAVRFARRAGAYSIRFPSAALTDCLPADRLEPGMSRVPRSPTPAYLDKLHKDLRDIPLEAFDLPDYAYRFKSFVLRLGAELARIGKDLLLLLDKADLVPTPTLAGLLALLDQSGKYIVVLAVRSGQMFYDAASLPDRGVAGDHYGITHLGSSPRKPAWIGFVQEAIRAQLGTAYDTIPTLVRDDVLYLSRESVRTALETLVAYLRAPEVQRDTELLESLAQARTNLLRSTQQILRKFRVDFAELVRTVRQAAEPQNIPVRIALVRGKRQGNLFAVTHEFDTALQFALRAGAISIPEGEKWFPGEPINAFELAPLLAWGPEMSFPLSRLNESSAPGISFTEAELVKTAYAPRTSSPTIFVAYNFGSEESRKFRAKFKELIAGHRVLSEFEVTDGHVPPGTQDWAAVVRKRIKAARVVVADVTSLNPEVLYELGLAYGMNKILIPTVRSGGMIELPGWLRRSQIGRAGSIAEVSQLLASLLALLQEPRLALAERSPKPVPSLACWLESTSDVPIDIERFTYAARQSDLLAETLRTTERDETSLIRGAAAGLLVISLNGTERDALAHYVAGAVVANPLSDRLARRVLAIEHAPDTIAEGLRRSIRTVTVVKPDDVKAKIESYGRDFGRWAHSKPTHE